jgi:hypothetical protein
MNEEMNHLFSLVFGINLILIGAAACMALLAIIFRKKRPVLTSYARVCLILGPLILLYGIHLVTGLFR